VGFYAALFVAGPFLAWRTGKESEEVRRVAKAARQDAEGLTEKEAEEAQEEAEQRAAPVAGSPEARAPITTQYVRGQGKGKKRKKGKR
jgi:hypothetical protein